MYARYTEVLRDLMKNEHTAAALNKALSTYPIYQGKKAYDLIPTREELNAKLLNHYKYREIGFETVGRFLDELEITMCEIMPLYNERFRSIEIMADIEDPFGNVDITETYEEHRSDEASGSGSGSSTTTSTGSDSTTASSQGENNHTSSGTNNQTSSVEGTSQSSETNNQTTNTSGSESGTSKVNNKRIESDTPQASLTITAKGIDNVTYASKAIWDETEGSTSGTNQTEGSTTGTTTRTGSEGSESSTEGTTSETGKDTSTSSTQGSSEHTSSGTSETTNQSTSQSSGTTSHTFTKKGNQGVNTYAHDMIEFRKSFIDVVNEIINDKRINELFMLVY